MAYLITLILFQNGEVVFIIFKINFTQKCKLDNVHKLLLIIVESIHSLTKKDYDSFYNEVFVDYFEFLYIFTH